MANYAVLKAAIEDVIKTNGNNEITGELLQESLIAMINSLGAEYQFAGVATIATNPGTPDHNVFYIAGDGLYTNFGATNVPKGCLGIFSYNGNWIYNVIDITNYTLVNVNDLINQSTPFASAGAARSAIPQQYRKPGLHITYLLITSENVSQWVQDMFISDDVTDWSVADNWQTIGPVSVLQNTLTIGGDDKGELMGQLVESPEWIWVLTSQSNKILFGIRKSDGAPIFGYGCPPQVVNYITNVLGSYSAEDYEAIKTFLGDFTTSTLSDLLNEKVDKENGKSLIDSTYASCITQIDSLEYINLLLDKKGNILLAVKRDGTIEIGGDLSLNAGILKGRDNSEFSYLIIDNQNQIIFGIRKDGSWFLPSLRLSEIRTQWFGKIWYAYGTSLTSEVRGYYPYFIRDYSGMELINKGISGGGIISDTRIRQAIFDDTDGKENADLITLECWANDSTAPLGTVMDTGDDTFCGVLAQCLIHLQQVTTAQLVFIMSMPARYALGNPSNPYLPTKLYNGLTFAEITNTIGLLCQMYGVYFINPNDALGMYRKTDDYYRDNIHHTALGGEVFAKNIWLKLKNIPIFNH